MTLTVTANTPATAAQYNALIPRFLLQSGDQTLNTTTFTNHNTFASISIPAGESWELQCNLVIGDSTAASDIKTQWILTGTVASGYRHIVSAGVSMTQANDIGGGGVPPTIAGGVNLQARTSGASVSHGVTSSSSVFTTLQEKFIIGGGASGGTVTLQWACVAASGNVIVKAGSHLIMHRYD